MKKDKSPDVVDTTTTTRRHDIDWIRVLAVYLLIPFHTAIIFLPWGISFVKNNQTNLAILGSFVSFDRQWHMPLLFLISGVATWYSLKNRPAKQYLVDRVNRLLKPLIFSIFVIAPPLVYCQRLQEGVFSGSFLQFYPHFFNGVYPEGNLNWGHLWFLAYLFVFSFIAISLFQYLKGSGRKILDRTADFIEKPGAIFLFAIPLCIVEAIFRARWPGMQNLVDDWANFFFYITVFIYGFIIASDDRFTHAIDRHLKISLFLGIVTAFFVLYLYPSSTSWESTNVVYWVLFMFLRGINSWLWIIVILGLGHRFLNFTNGFIKYLNEASLPIYILHLLVIVVIGYFVVEMDMGVFAKFFIITSSSIVLTTLIYDICVKRTKVTRFLFGIRPKK